MKRIATNSFFLPYQVKWIMDNSRLKIMEKSRQIGISLAAAYSVVRRHMSGMGYYDTWISSRDDLQAMLFLDDCKKFAKIISQVCSILGNKVVKSESTYSFRILGVGPIPFGSSRLSTTIAILFSCRAFSIWRLWTSAKRFITNKIVGIFETKRDFNTSDSISVELKQATQSFSVRLSVHWKTYSYSPIGVLLEQRNNVFSLVKSS